MVWGKVPQGSQLSLTLLSILHLALLLDCWPHHLMAAPGPHPDTTVRTLWAYSSSEASPRAPPVQGLGVEALVCPVPPHPPPAPCQGSKQAKDSSWLWLPLPDLHFPSFCQSCVRTYSYNFIFIPPYTEWLCFSKWILNKWIHRWHIHIHTHIYYILIH